MMKEDGYSMALRKIRYHEDAILRKRAKEVSEIDDKLTQLLDDMAHTLDEVDGLGIAAPQVGVLRRVVVISYTGEEDEDGNTPDDVDPIIYELINPVILEQSGSQQVEEACLSVAGKKGLVDRPSFIKISATNRAGEAFELIGEGLLARALSHEIDHLDGVLFIDKAIKVMDKDKEEPGSQKSGKKVHARRKGKKRR